jgi:hypothetical protein
MKKISSILLLIVIQALALRAQTDRHVILVIIDGARYSETLGDTLARYVPRMHKLAQQGVVADSMVNDSVTVTARAIPAIWSGSWSAPKDTVVNGLANQYATVPTVWEYFRKDRGFDSTHAMYIMKRLATPWIQSFYPGYGPAYWPWYVLQGTTDMDVWQNAKSLLQRYHPDFAVIYLPDVDSAPARGWSAYTQAIMIADSIVGMLWDFVQADPVYHNATTLLVTNDHGRHLDGVQNGFVSHGDGCWGCRHIMLLGVGAGMPRGLHTSTRHTIADITPTIGSLLHFSTPYSTGKSMTDILTAVGPEEQVQALPTTTRLDQNYPNPFNPTTNIGLQIVDFGLVSLKVFDVLGREVATLVNEVRSPGTYTVRWDGSGQPSGVYFYRLQAGGFVETKRMIMVK